MNGVHQKKFSQKYQIPYQFNYHPHAQTHYS